MSSSTLPLRNSGIYHSLPTFPSTPELTNLTAMITGANGISGFHTLRALLDSPERWAKIYAVSRRPPPESMMALLTQEQRTKVQHVASDFLETPERIAEAMKKGGVEKVDYIFFYSYLQPPPPSGAAVWSNADELVRVNEALLKNFLDALPLVDLRPKRILLQTGAKNYGVHYGRARNPCIESDPQPSHLGPNFYYAQESALFAYCKSHPGTSWNVVMPAWIIGATSNAQMNALLPFSYYASVCAVQNVPLKFPGDWSAWMGAQHHSCARLTGYLSEWVVLEEKCKDQRFNAQDTSPVSMDRFFGELVRWFGVKEGVSPPADEEGENMICLKGAPGKDTPMGYGPVSTTKFSFTLTAWAKDPKNHETWKQLMENSNGKLTYDPFLDVEANFSFGDAAFLGVGVLGMNKARRLGWTGFVDTLEGVWEMYDEMGPGGLGMVPGMVGEVRALV